MQAAPMAPYGNGYRLDVTNTSGALTINLGTAFQTGQMPQQIRVENITAAVDAFIVWGYGAAAPTVVAPTVGTPANGIIVQHNSGRTFTVGAGAGPNFYLSAICGTTCTIYVYFGDGI